MGTISLGAFERQMLLCALPLEALQIPRAQVGCGCVSASVITGKVGRRSGGEETNKAGWLRERAGKRNRLGHIQKILKGLERNNSESARKM